MWKTLKNALISVTDAAGIEIPGLPIDLGAIDAATGATDAVTGLPLGDIMPK